LRFVERARLRRVNRSTTRRPAPVGSSARISPIRLDALRSVAPVAQRNRSVSPGVGGGCNRDQKRCARLKPILRPCRRQRALHVAPALKERHHSDAHDGRGRLDLMRARAAPANPYARHRTRRSTCARPDLCEMVSGLYGTCRHLARQKVQTAEPDHGMHEGRRALIDSDAPLHPTPVEVPAHMPVQMFGGRSSPFARLYQEVTAHRPAGRDNGLHNP